MPRWPKSWLAKSPGAGCPACGEASGRPVLRGMPTPDVFEAVDRGEIDIVFGGCCVSDDDRSLQCNACGHAFDPPRGKRRRPTSDGSTRVGDEG